MNKHHGRRVGYIASHQSIDACREALEARISNRPWFLTRQPLSGRVGETSFAVRLERVTREQGWEPPIVTVQGEFEPVNRGTLVSFHLEPGGEMFWAGIAMVLVGFLIFSMALAVPSYVDPLLGVFGVTSSLMGTVGLIVLNRRACSDAQFDAVLAFLARAVSGRVVSAQEAERLIAGLTSAPRW